MGSRLPQLVWADGLRLSAPTGPHLQAEGAARHVPVLAVLHALVHDAQAVQPRRVRCGVGAREAAVAVAAGLQRQARFSARALQQRLQRAGQEEEEAQSD